jgi:FixJ family two-component response regulator
VAEAARGLSAGCVLLEIQMPDTDGLEVQARLNRLGVLLPVIVMTAHGDVAKAVKAGGSLARTAKRTASAVPVNPANACSP